MILLFKPSVVICVSLLSIKFLTNKLLFLAKATFEPSGENSARRIFPPAESSLS